MIRELGLRAVAPASWAAGARAERGVFVSPVLPGEWVLAAGPDLSWEGAGAEQVPPLLARLSEVFGEAAWFRRHDELESHGWALARRGEVVRAFAWEEEQGPVMSVGEVTADERELGCFVDDPRDRSADTVKWWPDGDHVLALAGRWSLAPELLADPGLPASTGWLGRL